MRSARTTMWGCSLGAALLAALAACGSEGALENCFAGARVACDCDDGSRGFRTCSADGTSSGRCEACGQGSAGGGGASTGGSGGCSSVATWLDYQVVDAEYSTALDRLIMVSPSPPALHVYDATTHSEQSVPLMLPPAAVSVAPNGLSAAVAHDGGVSIIDLTGPSIVAMHSLMVPIGDIVMAGNGWVYAFPTKPTSGPVYGLEIQTGGITSSSASGPVAAHTRGRLHPSGVKMYGVESAVSPEALLRFDIDLGAIDVKQAPNPDILFVCEDLWFSTDGKRIVTQCGELFTASADPTQDMQHDGRLDVNLVRSLWHNQTHGEIAVLPGRHPYKADDAIDIPLLLLEDEFLTQTATAELPCLSVDDNLLVPAGAFVFATTSNDAYVVILEGDMTTLTDGRFAVGTLTMPD